jgi:hypothetical protein
MAVASQSADVESIQAEQAGRPFEGISSSER